MQWPSPGLPVISDHFFGAAPLQFLGRHTSSAVPFEPHELPFAERSPISFGPLLLRTGLARVEGPTAEFCNSGGYFSFPGLPIFLAPSSPLPLQLSCEAGALCPCAPIALLTGSLTTCETLRPSTTRSNNGTGLLVFYQ